MLVQKNVQQKTDDITKCQDRENELIIRGVHYTGVLLITGLKNIV